MLILGRRKTASSLTAGARHLGMKSQGLQSHSSPLTGPHKSQLLRGEKSEYLWARLQTHQALEVLVWGRKRHHVNIPAHCSYSLLITIILITWCSCPVLPTADSHNSPVRSVLFLARFTDECWQLDNLALHTEPVK